MRRQTVAAAIEGQDTIALVDCTSSGQLTLRQQLQLPGVFLPNQVQFDTEGQLWVVGGPLSGSQAAICIGVAQQSGQEHQVHMHVSDTS